MRSRSQGAEKLKEKERERERQEKARKENEDKSAPTPPKLNISKTFERLTVARKPAKEVTPSKVRLQTECVLLHLFNQV
jgi:hypothetical protein